MVCLDALASFLKTSTVSQKTAFRGGKSGLTGMMNYMWLNRSFQTLVKPLPDLQPHLSTL